MHIFRHKSAIIICPCPSFFHGVSYRENCVKTKLEVNLFHAIDSPLQMGPNPFVIPYGTRDFINYLYVTFGDK